MDIISIGSIINDDFLWLNARKFNSLFMKM